MNKKLIGALLAAALLFSVAGFFLVNWAITQQTESTTPPPVSPVDGFKPFASFRASDPPGTVFRQSADGQTNKVITLDIETSAATEVTYDVRAIRRFSAMQLLKIVADTSECSPATAKFDAQAVGEVSVSSISGQREYTFDVQIDPALRQLEELFANQELAYRASDTYWVIRETIRTDEVEYLSSRDWLVGADAEASLHACSEKSAGGTANVTLDTGANNTLKLKKKFSEPLRGWYLAERLQLDLPFGSSPGVAPEIHMAKDTEPPATQAPDL